MFLTAPLIAAFLALVAPFSTQVPPRDPPPPYVELARQEAELKAEIAAGGLTKQRGLTLATLLTRQGKGREAIDTLEQLGALDAGDRTIPYMVATYIEEMVRRGTLSDDDKRTLIPKAIAAADRALALDGSYAEAMVYKNILLRHQARLETDRVAQERLIAEADVLRERAQHLIRERGPQRAADTPAGALPAPPPPPLPPGSLRVPCQPGMAVNGQAPVRVGGNIRVPTKIKDARPVYPDQAVSARIQGVVIIEGTIAPDGTMASACVLRSIPLLDNAALDAVSQWQFEPTLLNGVPVPVIMTMTVNFTLE